MLDSVSKDPFSKEWSAEEMVTRPIYAITTRVIHVALFLFESIHQLYDQIKDSFSSHSLDKNVCFIPMGHKLSEEYSGEIQWIPRENLPISKIFPGSPTVSKAVEPKSTVVTAPDYPTILERKVIIQDSVEAESLETKDILHQDEGTPPSLPSQLQSSRQEREKYTKKGFKRLARRDAQRLKEYRALATAHTPQKNLKKPSASPSFIRKAYTSFSLFGRAAPYLAPLGFAKADAANLIIRTTGIGLAVLTAVFGNPLLKARLESYASSFGLSSGISRSIGSSVSSYLPLLPLLIMEGVNAFLPERIHQNALNKRLSAPIQRNAELAITTVEKAQNRVSAGLGSMGFHQKQIKEMGKFSSQAIACGMYLLTGGASQSPLTTALGYTAFVNSLGLVSENYHISRAKNFRSKTSALDMVPLQASVAVTMGALDTFNLAPRLVTNSLSSILLSPFVSSKIVSHPFYKKRVAKPFRDRLDSFKKLPAPLVKSTGEVALFSLGVFRRYGIVKCAGMFLGTEVAAMSSLLTGPMDKAHITGAFAGAAVGYVTQSPLYAAATFEVVKEGMNNSSSLSSYASAFWKGITKVVKVSFQTMEDFANEIDGHEK